MPSQQATQPVGPASRRHLRRLALAGLVAAWAALFGGGCASSFEARPETPAEQEPADDDRVGPAQDTDAVDLELDRAEQQLWGALEPAREPERTEDVEPRPAAPPAAGQPSPLQAPRRQTASPCAVACRALGSMRRAADRLCAITGSDHERCTSAEERVERATAQVRRACPPC